MRRGQREAYSDATRYLCAGAELDEKFANAVIKELFTQPNRAVAPSYGIDIAPIVKHCIKGRSRRAVRDVALLVLVLIELLIFPIPVGIVILLVFLVRGSNLGPRLEGRGVGLILGGAAVIAAAVWLSGVHTDRVTRALQASVPGATSTVLTLAGVGRFFPFLVSVPIFLLVTVLIRYFEWHYSQRLVGSQLNETAFRPDAVRVRLSPRMSSRLDVVARQQYTNVTVFKYDAALPFIGAGHVGRWWSFAVNLQRRTDEPSTGPREIEPFTALDLHSHIEQRLLALRKPEAGLAYTLPGIEISDHFFAPGWFRVNGKPPHIAFADGQVDRAHMERIVNGPAGELRHFKSLRVEWQGRRQVSTTFLHLATEGRTLYVELTPCLLSPIPGWYTNVDSWRLPRFQEVREELRRGVRESFSFLAGAPRRLADSYWVPYQERLQYLRYEVQAKTSAYVIDYGATTSVRELGQIDEPKNYLQLFHPETYSNNPRRYMQLLDSEKYAKTVEVQTFDAIIDFLGSHGVDTSEFRTRQASILNQGTFIGSIQGDIVAVGQGAKAVRNP
jgi:hypothetical protein